MRGTWIVACAIAMVGCDNGFVIEVRTRPGMATKNVELFLGLEPCDDCPAIRPMGATAVLDGEVYFRDGDKRFTAPVDSSGSAFFRVLPSDKGYILTTVVAVSAEQDAAAIIYSVDVSIGNHWVMQLEPATPSLHVQGEADGQFVQVWHQTKEPSSACIAFESWHEGQLAKRTFVVPTSDPDCDDFTDENGECAAFEWVSSVPPSLDEVSCVMKDMANPNRQFCVLGGRTCVDGEPTTVSCGPSDYCVPSELCDQCGNSPDPAPCVADLLRTQGVVSPKLVCQLPVQPDLSGNFLVPCPGTTRFPFGDFERQIPKCNSLELSQRPSVMNGIGPFSDRVTLTTGNAIAMREAELKVRGLTAAAGCAFDMEWSGRVADPGTGIPIPAPMAMMSLTPTVDLGVAEKHLLMPLSVVFVRGCTSQPSCSVGSDFSHEIYNCAPAQPQSLTFGDRPGTTHMGVTIDTYIDNAPPIVPHGSADSMRMSSGSADSVGLIRFDLSAIAPTTQVTGAVLHLGIAAGGSPGTNLAVFKMLERWQGDSTYAGPFVGQQWQGIGATFPSRPMTSETVIVASGLGPLTIDLPAALIQGWVDNPLTQNFGLALVAQASTVLVVHANETVQTTMRPMLEVTLAP